jgi:hypothetical protein
VNQAGKPWPKMGSARTHHAAALHVG